MTTERAAGPYWDREAHERESSAGTHLWDASCQFCNPTTERAAGLREAVCTLCLDGAGMSHNGAYKVLSVMGRDGEFHEQLEPCNCKCHRAATPDPAGLDVERLAREYDDLEAEIETEDVLLDDAEVETIYAAYQLVLGLEARTARGRRDIIEPLYRAVIQARINTARRIAAEYARLREDAG